MTDSNGREATPDSIKHHIPREEQGQYDIKLFVAYTTDEAVRRVGENDIDVKNATVIVDNLTNDIRGTRQRPAASPEEFIQRVDRLRGRLREAGAAVVVVCEIKPMEVLDVTPYNRVLHHYLRAVGDFGCQTQIRRSFLQRDGYHIQHQYDSVLDKTYACALMGIYVPRPTPVEDFLPEFARRRREQEWPRLAGSRDSWGQRGGGGLLNLHGW